MNVLRDSRILRCLKFATAICVAAAGLWAQSNGTQSAGTGTPPALSITRSEKAVALNLALSADSLDVEAGKSIKLSARATLTRGQIPTFTWTASAGSIQTTQVAGEVDFIAPAMPGKAQVDVSVSAPGQKTVTQSFAVSVVPVGALKRTALVTIEVDTNTLKKVWVSSAHPAENFKGPLKIKGTFRYDPTTGDAFAGGSWPLYDMRDDGKEGDRIANDGIWTIRFNFEKSDGKVYFAFDDTNEFRVDFESGLAWRLKMAWINLDEFKDDFSNPAFIPMEDQVLLWDQKMADAGQIYSPAK